MKKLNFKKKVITSYNSIFKNENDDSCECGTSTGYCSFPEKENWGKVK